MDELLADAHYGSNPTVEDVTKTDENSEEQSTNDTTDVEDDSHASANRRSTRARTQPERLEPTMQGQSYHQTCKGILKPNEDITFEGEEREKTE